MMYVDMSCMQKTVLRIKIFALWWGLRSAFIVMSTGCYMEVLNHCIVFHSKIFHLYIFSRNHTSMNFNVYDKFCHGYINH